MESTRDDFRNAPPGRLFFLRIAVALVLVLASAFLWFDASVDIAVVDGDHVTKNASAVSLVAAGLLEESSDQRHTVNSEREQLQQALERLQLARQAMEKKIESDYGSENYKNMFHTTNSRGETVGAGRALFVSPNGGSNDGDNMGHGLSWHRMKRRLMMKLLQVQVQQQSATSSSDVVVQVPPVTYRFMTGGHSSAAGHGNLYHESYTNVMMEAVKPVFETVGINFDAKNYAMGGTRSAFEIAWCQEEIFGMDLDVLTWDFAANDGRAYVMMDLYCRRAGRHPARPTCLALHKIEENRLTMLKAMENDGMSAVYLNETTFLRALDAVPDTMGLVDEQIAAMPPNVRQFRCGSGIEAGEPGCDTYKFNNTICSPRRHQAKWHPGWKWHALKGNLLALALSEILEEAVHELLEFESDEAMSPHRHLEDLKSLEKADHEAFDQTTTTEPLKDLLFETAKGFSRPDPSLLDADLLYRGHTFCHTGLVPSEIRYNGILTETTTKLGMLDYEMGVPREAEAMKVPNNESNSMRLVYEDSGKDRRKDEDRDDCPVLEFIDFKDYFFVHHFDDWKTLEIPNDSEVREYNQGKQPSLRGLIAVCFPVCPFGQCPTEEIKDQQLVDSSKAEMLVNGEPVVALTSGLAGCQLLQSGNGHYFTPNSKGRFEISARVVQKESFLRFSTIVVW